MRILIDILHPAHVHFFRNFYTEMQERGHALCITARAKECSLDLLERYNLPYKVISRQGHGTIGLIGELIQRSYRLTRVMRQFRPDVMTGVMGPSIAIAGKLYGVPSVIFYDTEFAIQSNWFAYPLAHSVCTPDCYQDEVRGTHRTYPGYHELAYLHPSRFEPDRHKLAGFGLKGGEPYSIVRFVSWAAVHDRRELGLSVDQKRALVDLLEKRGRVLITSEGPLPGDLESRRLVGPVEDVHHLLAFAQVVVGESATMSSEAAVLGVPAIFIAKTGRGYTQEQERRYGLVRHFTEDRFDVAARAIEGLFNGEQSPDFGSRARERLLAEKIDVTQWMIDYFELHFGSKP